MKKVMYIIITLITVLSAMYMILHKKPIVSIMGKKYYNSYIEDYIAVKMILENVDQYSYENALFDLIRQEIFIDLCEQYNVKHDEKALKEYNKLLHEDRENIDKIMELEHLLNKNYYSHFIKPYYCNYAFVHFILFDSLDFQSERYEYAKYVFNSWEGDKYDSMLNSFTEYFEQHNSSIADIPLKNKTLTNSFFEDISYYYITRENNGNVIGIRIKKRSVDDIMTNLPIDFNVLFYDEKLFRSIYIISDNTYWHKIIFNE